MSATRSSQHARELLLDVVGHDTSSRSSAARSVCNPRDVADFTVPTRHAERVGGLLLRHVEVEAADDRLALPRGKGLAAPPTAARR